MSVQKLFFDKYKMFLSLSSYNKGVDLGIWGGVVGFGGFFNCQYFAEVINNFYNHS